MSDWRTRAKAQMQRLGITQDDLTAVFGVKTRGAVGHYLNGRNDPPIDAFAPLADKLRLSLDELLRGEPGGAQSSQSAGLDDATMAQGVELIHLMAGARPEDRRFQRPTWAMILIAAKAIQKAEGASREAMAEILAELSRED